MVRLFQGIAEKWAPLEGDGISYTIASRNYLFKIYPRNNNPGKLLCDISLAAHFEGGVDSSSFNRYSSEALLLFHTEASNEPLMLCQTLNRAPGKAAVAEKN